MTEVAVKTHLIITDIHSEYDINWCGKLKDADPVLSDGFPLFIIRTDNRAPAEVNTLNMSHLEKIGKRLAEPHGREAVTTAKSYIYLKEKNNNERLMCIITHRKIKTFAPMYDKVGWRD